MWDKRPRIRWHNSQGVGNTQNKRMSGWMLVCYIPYVAAVSMLSLYAAYLMGDQFGLPVEESWPVSLWVGAGGIALILVWNEVTYARRKRALRVMGNAALYAAVLIGTNRILLGETWRQTWENGSGGLLLRFLERYNEYYAVSRKLSDTAVTSTVSEQEWAWVMLWVVAALSLQIISGMLRKRTVMLLMPAAVLTAGMAVGVTPGWRGMACMFAAVILSLYLDRNREFRAAPAWILAGLMAVLLPLTNLVMEAPASRINSTHDSLQAFQHRMEQQIRDYGWQALLMFRKDGRVDNQKPEYAYKEVLTVTVSERPNQTMYLRGYYGAEYEKGSWNTAENAFNWACLIHGISSGKAAGLLADLSSPADSSAPGVRMQYELQYTAISSRLAYLPYGADRETIQGRYQIRGDYVAEKPKSRKSLAFEGYAPGKSVLNDGELWDSDAQTFYLWYNEYVMEQYLAVPANMREVTTLVNTIKASDDCRAILASSQEDVEGRNAVRIALGRLVADKLSGQARYNIDPGPLPKDTDPVEYFLGENRQGFCIHFASAGALLLRQLGVPARFVSGYVVEPDRFREAPEGYQASVRDDDAHAWVEIWLEDVGWTPVEMTPGYEGTVATLPEQVLPPADTPSQKPEEESAENAETESAPLPTSAPQEHPPENRAERDAEADSSIAAANGSGNSQLSEEPEGWGFAGEGGWARFGQNGSWKISHVVFVILGIVAAATVWLMILRTLRCRSAWWRTVRLNIENGAARSALKVLNRRLYKRLRRSRGGILTLRSDEEYLAALKRSYPREDWESYLAVVRKAVYSQEEIGVEEAKKCYMLLRRVG